jgi:hypothetical protein
MFKIIIFFIFLIGASVTASEADEIRAELDGKLGLNNQGTEFWLSVPDMFYNVSTEKFYVLISSVEENRIRIYFPKNGKDSILTFEENTSKLLQLYPSREFGYYFEQDNKKQNTKLLDSVGINIISEKPITVQTLNSYYGFKNSTIVQPISSLGKEYMIQSYFSAVYRNEDSILYISPPEVTITSPYNENKVSLMIAKSNANLTIRLEDSTKFKAGDTVEVMMQKGDVWYVHSSDTLGDLSGSLIKTSKPVHLTYSHYVISPDILSNRFTNDIHTTLFPTEQWGKEFFIPSFSELNEHPVIRIYTQHEDNRIYRNGELWTSIDNTFENEVFESRLWPNDYEIENNEPTIITSDKPVSILLFPDYKSLNDTHFYVSGNVNTIVPIEQSTNYSKFSFVLSKFNSHYEDNKINKLEIYFKSEDNLIPGDLEYKLLDSVNDSKEWKSVESGYGNETDFKKIGTDYYCRKSILLPDSGSFIIKSQNTPFSGYFYSTYQGYKGPTAGTPTLDSYAFPISTNGLDLTSSDTTTPKVTLTQMNNRTHGIVYDFDENASGLAELYMLEEYSHNYNYKLLSADRGFLIDEEENSFITGEPVQLEFELTKKYPDADAFAVLYTTDKAGNDTLVFVNEELFTSVESESEIYQFVSVTNDELIFDNPIFNSKINKLSLFDINGSVVKSIEKLKMNKMNISGLNSGTYFLLIRTADRIYTKKFSVVR